MFYERGLVCETIQANEDGELLLQLHASDDCSLGAHAFRVRSDAGYSELRTIAVAPFPIVRDVPSNASLTLGHSVVGNWRMVSPIGITSPCLPVNAFRSTSKRFAWASI